MGRRKKKKEVNPNSKVEEFPKGIQYSKYEEILNSNNLVIVDIFTTWCDPCSKMKPIFEELSEQFDSIKFISVDLDCSEWLSSYSNYDLVSIPTFLLIKEGKLVKKQVGGLSKLEFEKLIEKIAK